MFVRGSISKYDPQERENYIKMPIEEKRKLYKCKLNFKTLENVKTWPEYCKENGLESSNRFKMKF